MRLTWIDFELGTGNLAGQPMAAGGGDLGVFSADEDSGGDLDVGRGKAPGGVVELEIFDQVGDALLVGSGMDLDEFALHFRGTANGAVQRMEGL